MPREIGQLIFAVFCLVGALAIVAGAVLEIGRARRQKAEGGGGLISPRQTRLRLISAAIWLLILGSLAYATIALWPQNANYETQHKFVSLVFGALLLLPISLALLLADVLLTRAARRKHEAEFQLRAAQMVRDELERARQDGEIPRTEGR